MHHARTCVALNFFDSGFSGQTIVHSFFETTHPATIMRKHAIGFEHFTMLAFHSHIAA